MGNPKSYDAVYLKRYRQRNPEKQEQWRISSEIRHLEKLGYIVTLKQPEEMTMEELHAIVDHEKGKKQDYNKRYREKHKDQLKAYYQQYRADHPEKYRHSAEKQREYAAKWRAKNRDHLREYRRQWAADHPERVREYQRAWREKNPGYQKKRYWKYKRELERLQREDMALTRQTILEARERQQRKEAGEQ